jgi:hypothetical protein
MARSAPTSVRMDEIEQVTILVRDGRVVACSHVLANIDIPYAPRIHSSAFHGDIPPDYASPLGLEPPGTPIATPP